MSLPKILLVVAGFVVVGLMGSWTLLLSTAAQEKQQAQNALVTFLGNLHEGRYAQAIPSFGGSYDTLRGMNPDLAPTDLAELWKRGCTQNGLNCLSVRRATFTSRPSPDVFMYAVAFSKADKTLFGQGPCCGDESNLPPTTSFEFLVRKTTDGKFLVETMPPYTP